MSSIDAPIRIEQPRSESGARPRRAGRIDGGRKHLAGDKSNEPFVPKIRLRGLERVKQSSITESARVAAVKAEAPASANAGDAQATEADQIAVAEAKIDDVIVEDEVAKAATAAEKEASSKRATAYAVDRAGVKDPGVPVNERFRVVGAMRRRADFKTEFTRLKDAEGGGKLSPQRLKQLKEQAGRNCYYQDTQRQIAAENGREVLEAVRENPVFQKALKRETERAVARAASNPEESVDMNDVAIRALAEVLAAEDVKNDKSILAMILKGLAMFGIGTALSLGDSAKSAVGAQG